VGEGKSPWRKLKCMLLRERSLSEKAMHLDSNFMTSGKGKTSETVKRSEVAGGWRVGVDGQAKHRE
jgi:hypothetical protein